MSRYRVWHNSNLGSEAFHKMVETVDEGADVIKLLADYDNYLGDIIPANAQGLEVLEDGEWSEWYNDDGQDICELVFEG